MPFLAAAHARVHAQANPNKTPGLGDWKESDSMDTILFKIRRDLCTASNRKLPQPPEGASYS